MIKFQADLFSGDRFDGRIEVTRIEINILLSRIFVKKFIVGIYIKKLRESGQWQSGAAVSAQESK